MWHSLKCIIESSWHQMHRAARGCISWSRWDFSVSNMMSSCRPPRSSHGIVKEQMEKITLLPFIFLPLNIKLQYRHPCHPHTPFFFSCSVFRSSVCCWVIWLALECPSNPVKRPAWCGDSRLHCLGSGPSGLGWIKSVVWGRVSSLRAPGGSRSRCPSPTQGEAQASSWQLSLQLCCCSSRNAWQTQMLQGGVQGRGLRSPNLALSFASNYRVSLNSSFIRSVWEETLRCPS